MIKAAFGAVVVILIFHKFGNWKRPNGRGRSFCVGDRTSFQICPYL